MSYQIITRITITPDLRVMVRMAANNIRPLDFRYDEVVSLTETLRTKGRPTLELELLSLFFKGLWQGRTRYDRAVGYTLLTDGIDKYEAWARCREDKEYERGLLLRMRGFLHYRPVPCRCHLEYQRSPVRRIYVGYISFRGRGAASFRASSTRRLHWSQRAGTPTSSKSSKKIPKILNLRNNENLSHQQICRAARSRDGLRSRIDL